MKAYEKLGAFYLGRPYDLEKKAIEAAPLLYDAADLTTHAVCVGMTGSGKTGLCVSLLEEAAIDGIPAIVIDPKGDMGNLMLTFPNLSGAEFEPWVQADDARRKEKSVADYASDQAGFWKKGLSDWDQDGERIERLRQACDCRIYTPGSEAGLPVSILASLEAPAAGVSSDRDLYGDRIETTVTSLLSLLGIEADPVQSKEHLLLSTLIDHQWKAGVDVDLGGLIRLIQEPPVTRVGVLELESFYPAKERFKLAMKMNALLASPGFDLWLSGAPLDIGKMLYDPSGKPQIAIFSIAHLSEKERMFFVSLLLNQVVGWVRSQPGTSNLRALLYMDEVFGYMPPIGEPPSKKPMLTLLKQARAHGLGVVLSTQNPVDLDYKGLSNAGTWFLGRLQTERDKDRVLEGLESLAGSLGRKELDQILSQLGKRVFLLHNVHEPAPVLFHTRWAMSYLRGPLARGEISRLMDPFRSDVADIDESAAVDPRSDSGGDGSKAGSSVLSTPPMVDPAIDQFYVPGKGLSTGAYLPGLVGGARLFYTNRAKTLEHHEEVVFWLPWEGSQADVDWTESELLDAQLDDLRGEPDAPAAFASLAADAASPRSYSSWKRHFVDHLYRSRRVAVFRSAELDQQSSPGEDERDFRIRLGEVARAERDRRTEELREKYAKKQEALEKRIQSATEELEKQENQARNEKLSAVFSFGTAVLGAVLGRKRLSATTVSRTHSAVRHAGRSRKESKDVAMAEESLEKLENDVEELELALQDDLKAIQKKVDPLTENFETAYLRPLKRDIEVTGFGLGWRR